MTLEQAFNIGKKALATSNIPLAEALCLLEHATRKDLMELHWSRKEQIEEAALGVYLNYVERRKNREPLSYITGKRYFYSKPLKVNFSTFIPRPETEILVETSIEYLRLLPDRRPNVLEIGTGSGAISAMIAGELEHVAIDACDISEEALLIARENISLAGLDGRVTFYKGDLFDALPCKKEYSLIVSNPPYIPSGRIALLEPEVQAEPRIALDGGKEGLDCIKRIIAQAPGWMKKGILLLEYDGNDQTRDITLLMKQSNFHSIFFKKDLSGFDRVIGGYLAS